MEGSFADELYSESLRLSKVELGPVSAPQSVGVYSSSGNDFNADSDGEAVRCEDGSLWDGSDEELDKPSELDREWKRRRDQFHTIGYRDGLIAGKEASAQEGFNRGFKESVLVGYEWGLVRGVSSALACLPDRLKELLIETQEKREKFQGLSESVHSLSTSDALKLFHNEIMTKNSMEKSQNAEASTLQEENPPDCDKRGSYFGELQSLLRDSPKIKVCTAVGQ